MASLLTKPQIIRCDNMIPEALFYITRTSVGSSYGPPGAQETRRNEVDNINCM